MRFAAPIFTSSSSGLKTTTTPANGRSTTGLKAPFLTPSLVDRAGMSHGHHQSHSGGGHGGRSSSTTAAAGAGTNDLWAGGTNGNQFNRDNGYRGDRGRGSGGGAGGQSQRGRGGQPLNKRGRWEDRDGQGQFSRHNSVPYSSSSSSYQPKGQARSLSPELHRRPAAPLPAGPASASKERRHDDRSPVGGPQQQQRGWGRPESGHGRTGTSPQYHRDRDRDRSPARFGGGGSPVSPVQMRRVHSSDSYPRFFNSNGGRSPPPSRATTSAMSQSPTSPAHAQMQMRSWNVLPPPPASASSRSPEESRKRAPVIIEELVVKCEEPEEQDERAREPTRSPTPLPPAKEEDMDMLLPLVEQEQQGQQQQEESESETPPRDLLSPALEAMPEEEEDEREQHTATPTPEPLSEEDLPTAAALETPNHDEDYDEQQQQELEAVDATTSAVVDPTPAAKVERTEAADSWRADEATMEIEEEEDVATATATATRQAMKAPRPPAALSPSAEAAVTAARTALSSAVALGDSALAAAPISALTMEAEQQKKLEAEAEPVEAAAAAAAAEQEQEKETEMEPGENVNEAVDQPDLAAPAAVAVTEDAAVSLPIAAAAAGPTEEEEDQSEVPVRSIDVESQPEKAEKDAASRMVLDDGPAEEVKAVDPVSLAPTVEEELLEPPGSEKQQEPTLLPVVAVEELKRQEEEEAMDSEPAVAVAEEAPKPAVVEEQAEIQDAPDRQDGMDLVEKEELVLPTELPAAAAVAAEAPEPIVTPVERASTPPPPVPAPLPARSSPSGNTRKGKSRSSSSKGDSRPSASSAAAASSETTTLAPTATAEKHDKSLLIVKLRLSPKRKTEEAPPLPVATATVIEELPPLDEEKVVAAVVEDRKEEDVVSAEEQQVDVPLPEAQELAQAVSEMRQEEEDAVDSMEVDLVAPGTTAKEQEAHVAEPPLAPAAVADAPVVEAALEERQEPAKVSEEDAMLLAEMSFASDAAAIPAPAVEDPPEDTKRNDQEMVDAAMEERVLPSLLEEASLVKEPQEEEKMVEPPGGAMEVDAKAAPTLDDVLRDLMVGQGSEATEASDGKELKKEDVGNELIKLNRSTTKAESAEGPGLRDITNFLLPFHEHDKKVHDQLIRPMLLHEFEKRDERRWERVTKLRKKYKALDGEWRAHCKRLDKFKERMNKRAAPHATYAASNATSLLTAPTTPSIDPVSGLPFYPQDLAGPTGASASAGLSASTISTGGRTRRSNTGAAFGYGDAVRSEAEFLEILASLETADMRDPTVRASRTAVSVPDMVLDESEKRDLLLLEDNRGAIADPTTYYGIDAPLDTWSDEEVEIFCKRYALYPKQFGKIAAELPKKTTAQCVLFYYRTKSNIDFRSLSETRARDGMGRKKKKKVKTDMPGKKGKSLLSNLQRPRMDDRDDEEEDEVLPPPVSQSLSAATEELARLASTSAQTGLSVPNVVSAKRRGGGKEDELPPSEGMLEAAEALGALAGFDLFDGYPAGPPVEDSKATKKKKQRLTPSGGVPLLPSSTQSANQAAMEKAAKEAQALSRRKATSSSYWSVAEKHEFMKLLGVHGKDFIKIAAGLENKTVVQCRNWFNNNSHKLNLEAVAETTERLGDETEDGTDGYEGTDLHSSRPSGSSRMHFTSEPGRAHGLPSYALVNLPSGEAKPVATGRGAAGLLIQNLLNDDAVNAESPRDSGDDWFGGGDEGGGRDEGDQTEATRDDEVDSVMTEDDDRFTTAPRFHSPEASRPPAYPAPQRMYAAAPRAPPVASYPPYGASFPPRMYAPPPYAYPTDAWPPQQQPHPLHSQRYAVYSPVPMPQHQPPPLDHYHHLTSSSRGGHQDYFGQGYYSAGPSGASTPQDYRGERDSRGRRDSSPELRWPSQQQ